MVLSQTHSLTLFYSCFIQTFTGNFERNFVVTHRFLRPFKARYVRIHPKTWRSHISFRVELYGCRLGENSTTKTSWWLSCESNVFHREKLGPINSHQNIKKPNSHTLNQWHLSTPATYKQWTDGAFQRVGSPKNNDLLTLRFLYLCQKNKNNIQSSEKGWVGGKEVTCLERIKILNHMTKWETWCPSSNPPFSVLELHFFFFFASFKP